MMFKRLEDGEPRPYRKDTRIVTPPEGAELPEIPTETEISTGTNRLGTHSEAKAKRLLDRVRKGETLSEAANNERMKVADLKDPDNPVLASLKTLVGTYFLPPEARKQMVRAGLNKLFLDNVVSDDPGNKKVALDAAKMIASDVEVGINQGEAGGVVINIGALAEVFKQLESAEKPEVKDGRGSGADRIIEADYEDVPAGRD